MGPPPPHSRQWRENCLKTPKETLKHSCWGTRLGFLPPTHPNLPPGPQGAEGGRRGAERWKNQEKKSYRIVYSFIGFGCICTCGAEAGPSWRREERCLWRNSHRPGLGNFPQITSRRGSRDPMRRYRYRKTPHTFKFMKFNQLFFFFFLFKKRTEDPLEKSGTPGWTLARVCCSVSLASCPHERVQAGRPSRSQHTLKSGTHSRAMETSHEEEENTPGHQGI